MNATTYEVHGALSFAQAKGRKIPYVCRAGHHKGRPGSGRYRVSIAGHPVLDERREQLRLCGPCKQRMIEEWSDALGIGVNRQSASQHSSPARLAPIAGDVPVGAA